MNLYPRIACLLWVAIAGCEQIEELRNMRPPEIVAMRPNSEYVEAPTEEEPADWPALTFSAPMDRARTEVAFSFSAGGEPLAGRFDWSEDRRTMTFLPDALPAEARLLIIDLRSSAEDRWGNSLRDDFRFSFSIGGEASVELISVEPEEGAMVTDLRTPIVLRFSEPVNRQTLYDDFSLEPSVQGRFRWLDDDRELRFEPLEDLEGDSDYHLLLSGTLRSRSGIPIEAEVDLLFSVMAPPEPETVEVALVAGDVQPRRLLQSTATLVENVVMVEKDDRIEVLFSQAVPPNRRRGLISLSPSIDVQMIWSSDATKCAVHPRNPLAWDSVYELEVDDEHYRFRVNGHRSRPPQIDSIWFLPDTAGDPTNRVQLFSGANLTFADGDGAALLFELTLAEGAEVDIASFAQSLSISSAGSIFTFETRDMLQESLDGGRRSILMPLTIRHADTPPDIVSVQLRTTLMDTLGNRLETPFRVEVNGL